METVGTVLLVVIPLAWFGWQFIAFCRDVERRDKRLRGAPDSP